MSAFSASELSNELHGKQRRAVVLVTGTASYDTNGSVIDLSALTSGGFTKVHGAKLIGVGAHTSDKYLMTFVPAASYAAATGTIKVRNALIVTTGTPGSLDEIASTTDLSALTFVFEVVGV